MILIMSRTLWTFSTLSVTLPINISIGKYKSEKKMTDEPEEIEPTESEKRWYLEGVHNAVLCIKCAIHDDIQDLASRIIHDAIKTLHEEIEETIDVNIDYMLSGE